MMYTPSATGPPVGERNAPSNGKVAAAAEPAAQRAKASDIANKFRAMRTDMKFTSSLEQACSPFGPHPRSCAGLFLLSRWFAAEMLHGQPPASGYLPADIAVHAAALTCLSTLTSPG